MGETLYLEYWYTDGDGELRLNNRTVADEASAVTHAQGNPPTGDGYYILHLCREDGNCVRRRWTGVAFREEE